jgi:uncharacterized protein YraI
MKSPLLFLLLLIIIPLPLVAQDAFNLLQNPDFENAAVTVVALDPDALGVEFKAPPGWDAYIFPRGDLFWQNALPASEAYAGRFTNTGAYSFKLGRGNATFTAALLQRVGGIPAGTAVVGRAAAYMQRDDGGGSVRIGIDPTGGSDPTSPNIVWSPFATQRSQWHTLEVRARAAGDAVTFFLYASQSRLSRTNNTYWDTSFLGIETRAVDTPPAEAGALPTGNIEVVIPNTNVNVRVGAGTTFESFALAQAGTPYPLISRVDGWYEINYFGRAGFVSADYSRVEQQNYVPPAASVAPSENLGPAPVPAGGESAAPGVLPPTGVVFAADRGIITLHSGPRRDFPDITTIPVGNYGDVVGRTEWGWLLVRYGEYTGWVDGGAGRIDGDVGIVPIVPCC